jgi:ABC-2 type transport system ATP-binding protein
VGTFSKGMTQRLGLAQALLHGPELLVLDEPTTGLDPEGRRLVAEIIAEEQAKGTTVFLSSHILSDVERSCDHVAMMRQGELVLSEKLDDLLGVAEDWEVEVTGLGEAQRQELEAAGFAIAREQGERMFLGCTSTTKKDLLRRLLAMPVEIGTLRPAGQTLEDLYMQHTRAR